MTTYADKMPNRMSKYMLEIMTKYMSERTPNIYIYIYMSDRVSENIPDTIFEHPCQIERQNICQIECQNIWQIECKNMWQIGCQYYILADRMPAYKYIYLYIYIYQIEYQNIWQTEWQKICQTDCLRLYVR